MTTPGFRFLFATPWWRLVWFIGAVVWCIAFNVLYISASDPGSLFGPISVIPIFAFLADAALRTHRAKQRVE